MLTTVCFIWQDVVFAQGGISSWAKPAQAKIATQTHGELDQIDMPYDVAMKRAMYKSDSGETIINIQDAHSSIDAQKSICKIFEELVGQYDMSLIGVEGSAGKINTALIESFPSKEVRGQVAESLLAETKINAAEFYKVLSGADVELYGLEDPELYGENIREYQTLLARQPEIRAELEGLSRIVRTLERKLFSDGLLTFNDNRLAFEAGDLKFTEYWKYLEGVIHEKAVNYRHLENLGKLAKAADLEEEINFGRADAQWAALIEELKTRITDEEAEALTREALDFKVGKITPGIFFSHLVTLAASKKIAPGAFNDFILYAEYALLYESIDMIEIFAEIGEVEDAVRDALLRSDEERELDAFGRVVGILSKFLEAKMSSADERFYRENAIAFSVKSMREYLDGVRSRHGISSKDDANLELLGEVMPTADAFYEAVKKRNDALLGNLLKRMREKKTRVAALVTGGFHTEGLSELMRQKRVSHIVFLPKYEEKDGERPYLTVITQKGSFLDARYRREAQMETIALTIAAAMRQGTRLEDARRQYAKEHAALLNKEGYTLKLNLDDPEVMNQMRSLADGGLRFEVTFDPKGPPRVRSERISLDEALHEYELYEMNSSGSASGIRAPLSRPAPLDVTPSAPGENDTDLRVIVEEAKAAFMEEWDGKSSSTIFSGEWNALWESTFDKYLRKKGIRRGRNLDGDQKDELDRHLASATKEISETLESRKRLLAKDSTATTANTVATASFMNDISGEVSLSPEGAQIAMRSMLIRKRGEGYRGVVLTIPEAALALAGSRVTPSGAGISQTPVTALPTLPVLMPGTETIAFEDRTVARAAYITGLDGRRTYLADPNAPKDDLGRSILYKAAEGEDLPVYEGEGFKAHVRGVYVARGELILSLSSIDDNHNSAIIADTRAMSEAVTRDEAAAIAGAQREPGALHRTRTNARIVRSEGTQLFLIGNVEFAVDRRSAEAEGESTKLKPLLDGVGAQVQNFSPNNVRIGQYTMNPDAAYEVLSNGWFGFHPTRLGLSIVLDAAGKVTRDGDYGETERVVGTYTNPQGRRREIRVKTAFNDPRSGKLITEFKATEEADVWSAAGVVTEIMFEGMIGPLPASMNEHYDVAGEVGASASFFLDRSRGLKGVEQAQITSIGTDGRITTFAAKSRFVPEPVVKREPTPKTWQDKVLGALRWWTDNLGITIPVYVRPANNEVRLRGIEEMEPRLALDAGGLAAFSADLLPPDQLVEAPSAYYASEDPTQAVVSLSSLQSQTRWFAPQSFVNQAATTLEDGRASGKLLFAKKDQSEFAFLQIDREWIRDEVLPLSPAGVLSIQAEDGTVLFSQPLVALAGDGELDVVLNLSNLKDKGAMNITASVNPADGTINPISLGTFTVTHTRTVLPGADVFASDAVTVHHNDTSDSLDISVDTAIGQQLNDILTQAKVNDPSIDMDDLRDEIYVQFTVTLKGSPDPLVDSIDVNLQDLQNLNNEGVDQFLLHFGDIPMRQQPDGTPFPVEVKIKLVSSVKSAPAKVVATDLIMTTTDSSIGKISDVVPVEDVAKVTNPGNSSVVVIDANIGNVLKVINDPNFMPEAARENALLRFEILRFTPDGQGTQTLHRQIVTVPVADILNFVTSALPVSQTSFGEWLVANQSRYASGLLESYPLHDNLTGDTHLNDQASTYDGGVATIAFYLEGNTASGDMTLAAYQKLWNSQRGPDGKPLGLKNFYNAREPRFGPSIESNRTLGPNTWVALSSLLSGNPALAKDIVFNWIATLPRSEGAAGGIAKGPAGSIYAGTFVT
ncbi:MAG: hypothetical protein HQL11_02810, partial [Candidatus Omnitrophica bacterium]|nr:hypothetical protein [Candidatus Omnitrophota bacterium]